MSNPLLEKFNTPYNTAPYSTIKNEHFKPAFEAAIEMARKEIDAITSNSEQATFNNTIAALDYSGNTLERISSIFFNLNNAETSKEIQQIAKEVSPLLSQFSNDVGLNKALFLRVKDVFERKAEFNLTPEENTLLEKKYKSFVRNGANLNEEDKEKLRKIDMQLAELSLSFGERVLEETNQFELLITNEDDLKGLPEGAKEAAKMAAQQKEKEGWLFTMDYPSYIPLMTYIDNRAIREQMAKAFGSRSCKGDNLDNQDTILKIVALRHERANLLGYKTHAHFILEERMASTPENVENFIKGLYEKSKPVSDIEHKKLTEFAQSIGGPETLEIWDGAYYKEKLKQQLFNLDTEKLKPYFKLENVVNGAFIVAEKLYGLKFTQVTNIDTWHEDVQTYEVHDESDNFVAVFYADFHPRPGKRNGAWMDMLTSQFVKDGENHRPHIINICNFTKPTASKPSLLTFEEVTTLFHEFGHGLHGMLANTTYPSLSGPNVYWDFVELPSQVLENWCYEKETLDLFAFHYETGEVIPMEMVEKIKESANFMEASFMLRQLSLGTLDMAWHNNSNPTEIKDVKAFEKNATKALQLFPPVETSCVSTAFGHIFQGGYSAGYYSYKWAEVLDADAFEYFKENGIFNREIGDKFKDNILSRGGSEHPMELYERFRGKKPDTDALLRRAGLLANENA